MSFSSRSESDRILKWRHFKSAAFRVICNVSTWVGIVVLILMMIGVFQKAIGSLDWAFLTRFDSYDPKRTGVFAGLWGCFWLMLFTGLLGIPVSVAAAIYLEEYSKKGWLTQIIQMNISNLAGVPSIVYGILGLTIFVRYLQLGSGVLSGALTMAILIMPIIIIASQEALRSVPQSLRHASLALGATKWQTIWYQVLPASVPGIMTGVILALSRAIGETAPLIVVGAAIYISQTPGRSESPTELITDPSKIADVPSSGFTVLPLQIYNYSTTAKLAFRNEAAAAIVVLLVLLLIMNGVAIFIRNHFQKKLKW